MANIWDVTEDGELWLKKAVTLVSNGIADKLSKEGVTVYRVGKMVRVDIKDNVKEIDDGYQE